MEPSTAAIQMGVLAAALALSGAAALLCRTESTAPDWPPSPQRASRSRQGRILMAGALLLFMAALVCGLLAVVALATA